MTIRKKPPVRRSKKPVEISDEERVGPALLFSDISSESAADCVQWIVQMNMIPSPPKELVIMINSEGGDLMAGMAIVEAVTASRIPVKTVAIGQIQSAGLIIFMSGYHGLRVITPSCTTMAHNFSTMAEGSYNELKNLQKEYDRLDRVIMSHFIKHTGLTEKEIRKYLITDHDVYLSPEQVVEYNLADRIGPLEL
jgi:ATP-dependent Clp protease protease subunit